MLTKELIAAALTYAANPENNEYEENSSEWESQEFELRCAFIAGAKWAVQEGNSVYKK